MIGGCFKTREVGPERVYLARLRSSLPSAHLKFHSNLGLAYRKEPR